MRNDFLEVWQRSLRLWALPLGFCLINLFVFSFYGSAFAGKVEDLELRYEVSTQRLAEIEEERLVIDRFLDEIEVHDGRVKQIYGKQFQTEAKRFTHFLRTVKDLAKKAGLKPTSLGYPKKVLDDYDLIQRDVNFSVSGTYDQLRKFINFLELTEHFITLTKVGLGGSGNDRGNPTLAITLSLTTMFSAHDVEPVPPEEET